MKLICQKNLLLEKINLVSKAVSNRGMIPITECILLTCRDDGLVLLANDLNIAIEAGVMDVDMAAPGGVALEARLLYEIIRLAPEDEVSVFVDENHVTMILSGSSEYKILGLPPEEFTPIPELEEKTSYKIQAGFLKNMIRQTIFSVAVVDSKPGLTGGLMELDDSKLHMVASDGFRISYRESPLIIENGGPEPGSLIVPPKALNEVSRLLQTEEDFPVEISYTNKHIMFALPGCLLVSRLIDGEFINYKQSFNEDHTTIITIKRQAFLMSLERVSVIASKDLKKNPVFLKIESDTLIVSAQTETGNVRDAIPVEADGSDLEISFNPRYLIESVRVIDDDMITLQFNSSLSPCIIKGMDDPSGRYLVLPLRQLRA